MKTSRKLSLIFGGLVIGLGATLGGYFGLRDVNIVRAVPKDRQSTIDRGSSSSSLDDGVQVTVEDVKVDNIQTKLITQGEIQTLVIPTDVNFSDLEKQNGIKKLDPTRVVLPYRMFKDLLIDDTIKLDQPYYTGERVIDTLKTLNLFGVDRDDVFFKLELSDLEIFRESGVITNWWFSDSNIVEIPPIPNYITKIGQGSFSKNRIEVLELHQGITEIGEFGFSNNKLKSLVLPDAITEIEDYSFNGNELTSLTMGSRVTHIGSSAFNRNKLESVIIPDSVNEIGSSAFGSNKLTLAMLDNVIKYKKIPRGFFRNNGLTELTIPSEITEIGRNALAHNKFVRVIIPSHIKKIGESAFSNNTDLTSVVFEDGVSFIDVGAFSETGLVNVEIPRTMTSLSSFLFYGTPLEEITIPNSVVKIGDRALTMGENAEKINIPSSVYEIADTLTEREDITLVFEGLDINRSVRNGNRVENIEVNTGTTRTYSRTIVMDKEDGDKISSLKFSFDDGGNEYTKNIFTVNGISQPTSGGYYRPAQSNIRYFTNPSENGVKKSAKITIEREVDSTETKLFFEVKVVFSGLDANFEDAVPALTKNNKIIISDVKY